MARTQSGNPEITVGSSTPLHELCVAQLRAKKGAGPKVAEIKDRAGTWEAYRFRKGMG